MASHTRIAQLATSIAENTKILDDYLQSHGLPSPTFAVDGPMALPIPESEVAIVQAKSQIIADTEELNQLVKGPAEVLLSTALFSLADVMGLHFTQRFNIHKLIPLDGFMSYAELAVATGLDEIDVERVLGHAMLNHLFEKKDGKVAHSAMSKALLEHGAVGPVVEFFTEDVWPSYTKTVEALDRYKGHPHLPEETGFSLANNTSKGLYDLLGSEPQRMERFARAMAGFAALQDFDLVIKAFDWSKVTTLVDVGGAMGPCSIELAKTFPALRCTVQDFPEVVAKGAARVPADLRDRVSFEVHNMFEPQKNTGADVYFFRAIFHNWPDVKCVEILKAQIPALKAGSHIIINDRVTNASAVVPPSKERRLRAMDLTMLTLFGARERTYEDWVGIVKEASPRFRVNYAGPPSNIIILEWDEAK